MYAGDYSGRIQKQPSLREKIIRRAAQVAALLGVALLAGVFLQPIIPNAFMPLMLLATVLSGWLCGRAAGLVTAVSSLTLAAYFFFGPIGNIKISNEQQPTAALFTAALMGGGWLSGEWRRSRDRSRENEEQYRTLLDGVRDHAVFLLDAEGHISTWNNGAQRINGYSASEAIGRSHTMFYIPEEVEQGKPQEFLRTAAKQGNFQTQGWRVRKDSTRFWAEVSITTLFDDGGRIRGFAKITRDMTDIKQNHEALLAKQDELRAVLEFNADAVLMVDLQGTILYTNSRAESMFAYGPKELLGKKVENLLPKEHRNAHVRHRELYQHAPHVRPMGTGLDLYGVKKDGTEFPVQISLGPALGASDQRTIASIRDVTESRRLERELQNRTIQEMAQLMIRELDGRIVQWNAGMKRMYGYSRGEAEGAISHEILRTVFPRPLESIEADLLRTGFWEGELVHRKKDGTRVFVNSYWVLHNDKDGKPWRILESGTDITALKEAEAHTRRLNQELEKQNADLTLAKAMIESQTQKIAVSAKMSALGEMAGGMAHEINNPMGIIHARASDLMEFAAQSESVPSKTVIDTMEKIRHTASRVTKITLGLRKFARETRNDPLVDVALKDVVEDTLSFCAQRLRQNCVELRIAPIQPSLHLSCKPTEISQVLLNLLNNAVDAVQSLPEKWIELSVQDAGPDLQISVTDSGTGIPETLHSKMGQPFFTTKEAGKGTGLGLSISRGIVEAHGGQLNLDTASDHTRFVVTLPKCANLRQEAVLAGR